VDEAHQAVDEAHQAVDEAHQVVDEAHQAVDEAYQAVDETPHAVDEAHQAVDEAHQAGVQVYSSRSFPYVQRLPASLEELVPACGHHHDHPAYSAPRNAQGYLLTLSSALNSHVHSCYYYYYYTATENCV